MGIKRLTFVKTLTTAGTAERLVLPANDIRSRAITIEALETNTGYIRVGGSTVSLTNGTYLETLDSVSYQNANYADVTAESRLSEIYCVASVSGEGVTVAYETEDALLI